MFAAVTVVLIAASARWMLYDEDKYFFTVFDNGTYHWYAPLALNASRIFHAWDAAY